jgi:predicted adenylyl cyclase CyaB
MPGANLEIKARCADLVAVRARAERLATSHLGVDAQVDTYFQVPRGRLKLRESSLSGGQLIPYLRRDERGPKRSDYQVIPVSDPSAVRGLLEAILGRHRVVRKRREIFLYENVRIHLDEVEGLGTFVELEAVFGLGDFTINTVLTSLSMIYVTYFLVVIAGMRPEFAGAVQLVGRTIPAAWPANGR